MKIHLRHCALFDVASRLEYLPSGGETTAAPFCGDQVPLAFATSATNNEQVWKPCNLQIFETFSYLSWHALWNCELCTLQTGIRGDVSFRPLLVLSQRKASCDTMADQSCSENTRLLGVGSLNSQMRLQKWS